MRIVALALCALLVLLAACASQPQVTVIATAPTTGISTPSAEASITPSPAPSPAVSPTATSDTTVTDNGENRDLSQPRAYWKLKLPRTWKITSDTGYQLKANNPEQTAFVHLLSQIWDTADVRPPTGQAYVDYWKNSILGDVFPVFANGDKKTETTISPEKFGGPYLLYEFDDARNGRDYMQVYASAGGPNSLVVTAMAKTADLTNQRSVLAQILSSAELVPGH